MSAFALVGFLFHAVATKSQSVRSEPQVTAAVNNGKHAFAARCASCHGLDGRGGERGPNIATTSKTQSLSDTELTRVISNGRPNSGMPAFRLAGEGEIRSLVAYLRILQGKRKAVPLAGDPQKGKELFFGKAECGSCHMAEGQGGFLGSDLSGYAKSLGAPEIRKSITDPASAIRVRVGAATTRDGTTVKGLVRNEDNFSVQIQSEDGSFHSFLKSDLTKLEYLSKPLMPTDYRERLSRQEVDDLVGYLQSLSFMRPSQEGEKW
jgi:cytochrome c oxidase cbb3-type subunit III